MNKATITRFSFLFLLLNSFAHGIKAQSENILDAYENYTEAPREIVYAHLNKTDFYKGEMIGFKVYVFDKSSKALSKNVQNLYCVISDKEDKPIKSSMLLVENGIAHSTFDIDSTFTNGEYTFKAYTNWMKNFKEPNYFSTKIKVNGFNTIIYEEKKSETIKPDIQVLPEGGHLVANTKNIIGVIAKNQFGKGLKDADAYLINKDNDTINKFRLNEFGIGKTIIIPQPNTEYKVLVKYGYSYYDSKVPKTKLIGISMYLSDAIGDLQVAINTNKKSLLSLKNKAFTVAIHNGENYNSNSFRFDGNTTKKVRFPRQNIFSGINIITVFDEQNNPILERLYFNYDGVDQITTIQPDITRVKDSITLKLKIPKIKISGNNSLSVSILPSKTKSYNTNENLISKLFLEPYLKGHTKNLKYYFTNVTKKTKYNLDLLLLTQGWSSYDWNNIFSHTENYYYDYEQGISFNANINNKKTNRYILAPLSKTKLSLVNLPEEETNFSGKIFPINNEKFSIAGLNKKGKTIKPNVYINFSPNKIPSFKLPSLENMYPEEQTNTLLYDDKGVLFLIDKGITQLDEVIINAKKEATRIKRIKDYFISGRLFVTDEQSRQDANLTFFNWLNRQPEFNVVTSVGSADGILRTKILNSRAAFYGRDTLSQGDPLGQPLIELDGSVLNSNNIEFLSDLLMLDVDYVHLDPLGLRYAFTGGGGVITIKTKNLIDYYDNDKKDNIFSKPFDLTFTANKKYYTPKYKIYNNDFFNDYGVIGWEPDLTISEQGDIQLTFFNTNTDNINLYIEGVINDDTFISEIKSISLN